MRRIASAAWAMERGTNANVPVLQGVVYSIRPEPEVAHVARAVAVPHVAVVAHPGGCCTTTGHRRKVKSEHGVGSPQGPPPRLGFLYPATGPMGPLRVRGLAEVVTVVGLRLVTGKAARVSEPSVPLQVGGEKECGVDVVGGQVAISNGGTCAPSVLGRERGRVKVPTLAADGQPPSGGGRREQGQGRDDSQYRSHSKSAPAVEPLPPLPTWVVPPPLEAQPRLGAFLRTVTALGLAEIAFFAANLRKSFGTSL